MPFVQYFILMYMKVILFPVCNPINSLLKGCMVNVLWMYVTYFLAQFVNVKSYITQSQYTN